MIYYKIFRTTDNGELLWMLKWLIAAVKVMFYLFKQRFTSLFCRVLTQAFFSKIVSFGLFIHTCNSIGKCTRYLTKLYIKIKLSFVIVCDKYFVQNKINEWRGCVWEMLLLSKKKA